MIQKTKEPGMSKIEQTWCVSSSGGSRRRAEKIKNSCWYESRKMFLVWLCSQFLFFCANFFALKCVLASLSVSNILFYFLDCFYLRPSNSTTLQHEQVDDCSFHWDSFFFLYYQILGIAYSMAKAIHSRVPEFSLLTILALHETKLRISHIFINIQLI